MAPRRACLSPNRLPSPPRRLGSRCTLARGTNAMPNSPDPVHRCATCYFFCALAPARRLESVESDSPARGICHRFPHVRSDAADGAFFPSHWCGEWRSKVAATGKDK